MAFGKRESYNDDLISYTESVDMLLSDMRLWGFKDLTKDKLNEILQGNSFSISRAVKMELSRILNQDIFRNKETTSTTYIGTKTDTFTFYQCDDCGCAEVLSNSYYCPNCGKKII